MAMERRDEILGKAVAGDGAVVPRYTLMREDGTVVEKHVALRLENPVLQAGMPYNKDFANEVLAASGVTAGTPPNLTLEQPGFVLADGAVVRMKPHVQITNSALPATLDVNGTGALAIYLQDSESFGAGMANYPLYATRWYELIYSANGFGGNGAWILQAVQSGVTRADTAARLGEWPAASYTLDNRCDMVISGDTMTITSRMPRAGNQYTCIFSMGGLSTAGVRKVFIDGLEMIQGAACLDGSPVNFDGAPFHIWAIVTVERAGRLAYFCVSGDCLKRSGGQMTGAVRAVDTDRTGNMLRNNHVTDALENHVLSSFVHFLRK